MPRHLVRGAIGFGLIGAGFVLTVVAGPVSLLLVPAGLATLRGCPMCWTIGLIATISDGRLERSCSGEGCVLDRVPSVQEVLPAAAGDS